MKTFLSLICLFQHSSLCFCYSDINQVGFFFQNIVTQLTNPSVVQINLCVELVSRVKKKNMPKNKPYHNCVIADVFFSQPLVCSGVNLRVLRRH